jgi:hypothetical protein
MHIDDPLSGSQHIVADLLFPEKPEAMRDMAEIFAEEFARMGYSAPRILALFSDPAHAGAHAALHALGETTIRKIIVRAVTRWP